MPSNGTIANVVLHDIEQGQGQTFQVVILTRKRRKNINITIDVGPDVRYLPSNNTAAYVALNDVDINFQSQRSQTLTSPKR